MSDHEQNGLADELPLLAASYRLTGDQALKTRVLEQLREMAAWSPLQRPGWTLYLPSTRLPPDGRDGNWLGTGFGVRAIANTLDIMPAEAIENTLRSRLIALLEKEIEDTVDDWRNKRPWFVKCNCARTNQWVLPTEGLIRACLVCGLNRHRDAYEMGVRNMLLAMDSHGSSGEFDEGVEYACLTVIS